MKQIFLCLCLCITAFCSKAQPANDEPCGAIEISLTLEDTCLPSASYSWVGATSSAISPLPGCQWAASKKDVWFKFTAPANGNVTISTDIGTVGTDFTMAIYSATTCSSGFTYLSCDDDNGPAAMPYLSQTGLTAGQVYYLRFWGFNIAQADGNVKICIFSEPLTDSKVGIGTSNPTTGLDINGAVRIRAGNPGALKILTSDNNGNASWQYPATKTPESFIAMAPLSGSNTLLAASGTKLVIPFQTDVQTSNTVANINFNNSTHIYSAPEAGVYHFEVFVSSYSFSVPAANDGSINIILETSPVNNSSFLYRYLHKYIYLKTGDYIPSEFILSGHLKLAAGEQARVVVQQNVISQYGMGTGTSRFSAVKIY